VLVVLLFVQHKSPQIICALNRSRARPPKK